MPLAAALHTCLALVLAGVLAKDTRLEIVVQNGRLQEATVGGCSGSGSGYNVGSCNGSGNYNVGGYTMAACSALHKQLCWECGVSHNCICIISEGPLIYVVTCLETPCSQKILLIL